MYRSSQKNFAWRDMILFERNLKQFNDPEETIWTAFKKFKILAATPDW
jgi:hypothetical protein